MQTLTPTKDARFTLYRIETTGTPVDSDDGRTIIGYDGIEIFHVLVREGDDDALDMYADESYRHCRAVAEGLTAKDLGRDKLEADRAELIAALERIERLTGSTGGPAALIEDNRTTARFALAKVRA